MLDPRYGTFEEWAISVVDDFSGDGLPLPASEAEWRDWARIAAGSPTLATYGVPDPEGFDDWREWAGRALDAMETGIG